MRTARRQLLHMATAAQCALRGVCSGVHPFRLPGSNHLYHKTCLFCVKKKVSQQVAEPVTARPLVLAVFVPLDARLTALMLEWAAG